MISQKDPLSALNKANAAAIDFIRVDLDTALTFTRIALATTDPQKQQRTTRTARKAYDTILRSLTRVRLRPNDATAIETKLQRLREDLIRLGESV